jgi:hypothetical protein
MRQFYFSPSVWFGGEYDGSAPRVEYSRYMQDKSIISKQRDVWVFHVTCHSSPSLLGIIGEAVFFSTRCGLPTRWGGVGGEPC